MPRMPDGSAPAAEENKHSPATGPQQCFESLGENCTTADERNTALAQLLCRTSTTRQHRNSLPNHYRCHEIHRACPARARIATTAAMLPCDVAVSPCTRSAAAMAPLPPSSGTAAPPLAGAPWGAAGAAPACKGGGVALPVGRGARFSLCGGEMTKSTSSEGRAGVAVPMSITWAVGTDG